MSCMPDPNAPPEACGGCDGTAPSTPAAIINRAGLGTLRYRIGTHAQFRESMLAGLSSSRYPALAGLRTRRDDDYSLGLIDAVACAADVLSFYQERLAHESYLRTATERVSLQEMGKLIGYRLRPGVAAETWLAFALETPRTPPPGLPPEPGTFVTGIPASLTLAGGLKVQSVPGPDEKPQVFETVEALLARPEWNAMRALPDEDVVPGFGARETWLAGLDTQLKVGDALLFVGHEFQQDPLSDRWDLRVLSEVQPDAGANRTRVAWLEPLGSVSPHQQPPVAPGVYAMRQRAAVFGHNAPDWHGMSMEYKLAYLGIVGPPTAEQLAEWPRFHIHGPADRLSSPTLSLAAPLASATSLIEGAQIEIGDLAQWGSALELTLELPLGLLGRPTPATVSLDRVYDGVLPQGFAALQSPDYTELFRITRVAERSRAEFGLSGKAMQLTLQGEKLSRFSQRVRDTTVFVQSQALARARTPIARTVSGEFVEVAGTVHGLMKDRRVIVQGPNAQTGATVAHQALLLGVEVEDDRTTLHIAPPLPVALRRAGTVVFGNVALATHGETGAQILGAGDASQPFQRFELKRLPLTYRSAPNEHGADSELTVRVGDVAWSERPTLFGAGAQERVYTLNTDAHGRDWVVFGDGVRGARLPGGVNNVRASYRQGLGRAGNVAADRLTQLMSRPLGLKGVSNPAAASGGADPEPVSQARRSMPLGTRTLGRAVSLLDYEDFALAFSGIAKARAEVLALPAGPTIVITVAGPQGDAVPPGGPIWQNLWQALKASGDPHVPIVLLSFQASRFRLGLKLKRDPAYEAAPLLAAVEAALRGHFAFDARALCQPVLQSDVIAAVHAVPGVVAVDLDYLYGGTRPLTQVFKSKQTRLLASRPRVVNGVARPAELLTLHPDPFDRLQEM